MRNFDNFSDILTIKRYSPNTVNTYRGLLIAFQKAVGLENSIDELSSAKLIALYKHQVLTNDYSQQSQKQLSSAIKLYFKEMHNLSIDFSKYATRSPQRRLPQIPSLKEVNSILNSLDNLKHKTALITIYALGLRSGELINLKITDLDGDRNQIFISNAKGRKDRVVPFPESLKLLLRDYYTKYKPTVYLFNGRDHKQYTATSLRKVFNKACIKAGIQKNLTLHSLRHAYATHLMDRGTDVRVIKELLGHNNLNTTLIYTHVTKKTLDKIPSPLDFLDQPLR